MFTITIDQNLWDSKSAWDKDAQKKPPLVFTCDKYEFISAGALALMRIEVDSNTTEIASITAVTHVTIKKN